MMGAVIQDSINMQKRFMIYGALAVVALALGVIALNTHGISSRQVAVRPIPVLPVDVQGAAERLAEAVRLRTVAARDDPALNAGQFSALHELLRLRFPKTHATLQREVVGGLSLLYTWQGSAPAAAPILLMAHQDVVAVSPGTEQDWAVGAFEGVVKDGFVWGRGVWDNKGSLMAQLEAVELLIASGYRPQRTVYLAFGADEEIGGLRGAAAIAALLKQRQVRLGLVLDEGLLITEGVMPGVSQPTALIGVAEKGYLSLELTARTAPGHASMPPAKASSAIAQMAAALKAIDDNQFPGRIDGVVREMFDTLAPEMHGFSRLALSNLWLFGPIVQRQLAARPSTAALLHTTTSLTTVHAGQSENVLPGLATATINYRLMPGESTERVVSLARQQIRFASGSDAFELKVLPGAANASPAASTASYEYDLLQRTIREVFPGTLVAPGLLVGGSDSKHFGELSQNIFKFSPVRARPQDLSRFHGTDERISLDNLAELIRFYHRFVVRAAQAGPATDFPNSP
jgi:carboxypeptidase PM20D1